MVMLSDVGHFKPARKRVTSHSQDRKGETSSTILRVITICPIENHLVYKLRSLTTSCLLCFIFRWYLSILLFRTTWRSQLLQFGNWSLRHYPWYQVRDFFILCAMNSQVMPLIQITSISANVINSLHTFISQNKSTIGNSLNLFWRGGQSKVVFSYQLIVLLYCSKEFQAMTVFWLSFPTTAHDCIKSWWVTWQLLQKTEASQRLLRKFQQETNNGPGDCWEQIWFQKFLFA